MITLDIYSPCNVGTSVFVDRWLYVEREVQEHYHVMSVGEKTESFVRKRSVERNLMFCL